MTARKGKFGRTHEAAIAALLIEPTIERAAAACGVGEKTLRRWLARPDFVERYRAARQEILTATVGELQRGALDAARVLRELLTNTATPAAIRVRAARSILASVFKGVETLDFVERLVALEQEGQTYEQSQATAGLP